MKLAGLKSIEDAHDESVWAVTWVPAHHRCPTRFAINWMTRPVSSPLATQRARQPGKDHRSLPRRRFCRPSPFRLHIAASASLDSFVRIFDVDSNSTITSFKVSSSEVWRLRFNPQVRLVIV
ncbi:hypothetical protein ACLB2K_007956 [Fragaria x ananassa]